MLFFPAPAALLLLLLLLLLLVLQMFVAVEVAAVKVDVGSSEGAATTTPKGPSSPLPALSDIITAGVEDCGGGGGGGGGTRWDCD